MKNKKGIIRRRTRRSYRKTTPLTFKRQRATFLAHVVLSCTMPRAFFAGITKKTHQQLLKMLAGMYEAGVIAAGGDVT